MDTSSSEDEISTDVLKEAVDQQFLNNKLYNTGKLQLNSQSKELEVNKSNRKSLRTNLNQENQFINFGVTATFQNFVAKKLDEMLERIIHLKQHKITDHCMEQQRSKKESGIRLLSSSKDFLSTTEIHTVCEKKSKKRKKCHEHVEDDDAMSKFREVAVDPEHILSKLDTKYWTSKRPQAEFKYKQLKNGTLIEQ